MYSQLVRIGTEIGTIRRIYRPEELSNDTPKLSKEELAIKDTTQLIKSIKSALRTCLLHPLEALLLRG